MAKSLPPVSAKVVADAEQFIAEFRRAERAAQGATGRIGNEVDKMAKTLSKKFSLGDVGKSLLQGFGLGSGFAVMDTVLSKVTEAYAEHQAALKQIDDTWKAIIQKSKEYQFSKLPTLDKRTQLQAEMDELIRKRDRSVLPKKFEGQIAGAVGVRYKGETVWGSTKDRQELADYTTKIANLAMEIEKLDTAMGPLAEPAAASPFGLFNASTAIEIEAINENVKELTANVSDFNRQAKINDTFAFDPKAIRAAATEQARLNEIAKEHLEVWSDYFELVGFDGPWGIARAMASNTADGAEEFKDSAVYFADGIESFLDDAIARGREFDDVIGDLGNSIASTFLKLSLVNPIMNSLFGKANGWEALPTLFGGFFADGGHLKPGQWGIAGENGPEPIFGGKTGMTVLPNKSLGGGGGDTFNFNYSFSSGVQRDQILPMMKMQERSIIARIVDAQRRGKQLSPAY